LSKSGGLLAELVPAEGLLAELLPVEVVRAELLLAELLPVEVVRAELLLAELLPVEVVRAELLLAEVSLAEVLFAESDIFCLLRANAFATSVGTTKTSMGVVSLSAWGISAQILASPSALTGCSVLTVIWNNTSSGFLVVAHLEMANESTEGRLPCWGLK